VGSEAPFGFESVLELNVGKMQKNAGRYAGDAAAVINTINETAYLL